MLSFEPRVGKVKTSLTSGGFTVIIPFLFLIVSIKIFNTSCNYKVFFFFFLVTLIYSSYHFIIFGIIKIS